MTTATVRKVATDFLTHKESSVLALKGAWGVGKTHFWDNLIKEVGDKLQPSRYSSVSLFGIASKRELAIALYANVLDFQTPPPEGPLELKNCLRWVWNHISAGCVWCFKRYARHSKRLPFGNISWMSNLPSSFEVVASHGIKNAVICLDDFERLDHKSFSPEELMGFINELKQQRGCKVVLIFNENELDETKEIFEKYREKIIDMELLYAPTAQETVAIAIPLDTPYRDTLVKHAGELGLTNIRVLRKIVRITRMMDNVTSKLDPQVMEQAVRTLVLFAWCYYEKNKTKPTLEFVLSRNPYHTLFDTKADSKMDPKLKNWDTLLRNYGFTITEDIDLTIKKIIEQGYLDDTGFEEKAQELNTQILNGQNKADLDTVWEPLNHSFDDNLDEFVGVVRTKFDKYVDFINLNFLNSLVVILRELGQSSFADGLIAEYFTARKNDHHSFDLKSLPSVLRPTDTILLERCFELQAKTHAPLTLDAAIRHFIANNSWDDAQMKPLQVATEEEFYNCFKQHKGEDLTDFVRTCQRYAEMQGNEAIAQRVHCALVRIGKENTINRFRVVKRFAITEEDLNKTN